MLGLDPHLSTNCPDSHEAGTCSRRRRRATTEVVQQALKDRDIMNSLDEEWEVVWTFDNKPSRPLWDMVDSFGIRMENAATEELIPRP